MMHNDELAKLGLESDQTKAQAIQKFPVDNIYKKKNWLGKFLKKILKTK